MLLANPGALASLLLIPVIVLLYMVRSRYQPRRVSSTMLWRSVRRDLEAHQRLRLPPLSLLMLLQLLAIAAGAAALARPALPAQDRTHLAIVIDSSAGMAATDVPPSRLEVAKEKARAAIRQLQPGDQVSLIQAGSSPTVLASGTETAAALSALDGVRPAGDSADVAAAVRVGDALIHRTGGQGSILLLSDGAFGDSFEDPEVAVPVDFQPIGTSGDNQGITALDVRQNLDGSGRWSAFARVSNYAITPVELPAVATVDGLLLDRRNLELEPRSSSDLVFSLPPGAKSFVLSLDTHDALPADDRAEARIEAPQQRKVLLVSKDPGPVEKLLHGLPALSLSTVSPESYTTAQGADLVVFDQFVPANLPGADVLIMNPPLGAQGFTTTPARTDASVLRNASTGLVSSVDLQSLRLGQTVQLETPEWANSVAEGPAGPLILQGERAGRRIVVLNFDWLLTGLARMQAFPLLLSNVVGELDPTALPRAIRPGEAVVLRPLADATLVTIEKPDGSASQLSLADGSRRFDGTDLVGEYTVTWKGSQAGEVASSFSVNLSSPTASDIAPRQHDFSSGSLEHGYAPVGPGRQLWPFGAMILLAMMAGEWIYFTRRS